MKDETPLSVRPPFQTQTAESKDPNCGVDCRTKLLVSIRNTEEAKLALASQVDWIDLKEPNAGALGNASIGVAEKVAAILASTPQRSAALGEIGDLDEPYAVAMAELFPLLKLGLSGIKQSPDWTVLIQQLAANLARAGSQLVPVIYADWRICDAPDPMLVVEIAKRLGSKYTLVDTYRKGHGNLLAWTSTEELRQMLHALGDFGCRAVLAGSINASMLDQLLSLPLEAIGIRGAVCEGKRNDSICPSKLKSWANRFGCASSPQPTYE